MSFENVWAQLSNNYHIYSIDCYGHGASLHNAKQYNVEDISKAIIVGGVARERKIVICPTLCFVEKVFAYSTERECNTSKKNHIINRERRCWSWIKSKRESS